MSHLTIEPSGFTLTPNILRKVLDDRRDEAVPFDRLEPSRGDETTAGDVAQVSGPGPAQASFDLARLRRPGSQGNSTIRAWYDFKTRSAPSGLTRCAIQ